MLSTEKDNVKDYNVVFASPMDRFLAFIIDFIVIYGLTSIFVFLVIKKDILKDINNTVEASFTIDTEGNIDNLKNANITINNDKTLVVPNTKEEKINKINTLVIEKIYKNKFCRYMVMLMPIIYNILYLMSKKSATIGQQLFRLVVVKQNGEKLNLNSIINRVFASTICCNILFLVPFTVILPILFSKNKFTLYDYFTNTCVIKVR